MPRMTYGERRLLVLEIVLGVTTLAGSNPASSANYQGKPQHHDHSVTGSWVVGSRSAAAAHQSGCPCQPGGRSAIHGPVRIGPATASQLGPPTAKAPT